MATITITGGTGLIGAAITKACVKNGHKVIILTRNPRPQEGSIYYKQWDVENGVIDETAIAEADNLIHLAGANVADGRWTKARKKEIVDSRVKSGELLVRSLKNIPNKIKTVVSASAIGWYGADATIPNSTPFIETSTADNSFLGAACRQWEASIIPVAEPGKRLVILRTGIVLSKYGGAYTEFKKPLQFGLATILGKGNQVISWIHIDDLVQLYLTAIDNENFVGIYNAVAPQPVSNKKLIISMAKEQSKYFIPIHVPTPVLQLVLGEMSIEVLKSATVSAAKILATGYQFIYPTIEQAVANLSGRS